MLHLKDQYATARVVDAESPSTLDSLALALFHRETPDAQFMVMTAYFDESGTHGDKSPATIFGGFVANSQQWSAYEKSLKELLNEFGIRSFHAKDYRQRNKEFKNMTIDMYSKFTFTFFQLIDRYMAHGIVIELRSQDYKEIYRPRFLGNKTRPDSEYGLCFRAALLRALIFISDKKEEWPLVPILEAGHRNGADVHRIYKEFKKQSEFSPSLGALAFMRKNDCLPLCAADSLVYAVFRRTAGFTFHPHQDAVPVGPSDPPFYVSGFPLRKTIIDSSVLDYLSSDLR
jgi:hypothetical protein